MSVEQRSQTSPQSSNGGDEAAFLDAAGRYGNAFLVSEAPDHRLPATGMPATDAMHLLERRAGDGRDPDAQPRDLRHDLDGARGAAR